MDWKKRLKDAGILALIFIAAVIGFSLYTNKGNDNMTADMGSATFPQISFTYNGFVINTLSGYAKEMDIPAMRDTLTPVSGQTLDGTIEAYDNKISDASYTVYSLDGREKLKEGKLARSGGEFTADLEGVGMAEERVLELVLNTGKDWSVRFYTRIADVSNMSLAESLDYIRNFHEKAMGKVEGAGVGMAIEPDETMDNTDFQHVTIHSNYDHVSWGALEPMVEKGERWNIKEVNSNAVSVQLEYRVRCKGEENDSDVYHVKEFFRVNHIAEAQKTYLLDYDRTMEQIFDASKNALNERGVVLGIVPRDVPYLVNDDGTAVSFVAANELWNYNKDSDEISQVFSFADVENSDVRNMGSDYRIKLLKMDGKGNTIFAVCGYMSRGVHEGEVGVAVYYYDAGKNSVEEKVFVASSLSCGNAVLELGRMIYYSLDRNILYVMLDGTLYEFDVKWGVSVPLVEGLGSSQYVIAKDGSMAAWQDEGELNAATRIVILDFETGEERTVECGEGECIRPLGFVKKDFVYGVAWTEDTGRTVSGEMTVPVYKIEIMNAKSEVVKSYQVDGIYVLDAVFDENMITLNRAVKEGDTYNQTAPDYITNNEEKEKNNIYAEVYATDLKETQVRLAYEDGIQKKNPKILKPKQIAAKGTKTADFDETSDSDRYYVYGYGELQGIYDKAGEAIRSADEYHGIVVDADQAYIWERGSRRQQHTVVGKEEAVQTMEDRLRKKEAPIDIVKELNDGRCLDLSGCSAGDLLYLLDQNIPVIGMQDAQKAVILIGYYENSVTYIDVDSGERLVAPVEMIDQMTSGSGNTYIG